jgi:short-subunit dehydrogenase
MDLFLSWHKDKPFGTKTHVVCHLCHCPVDKKENRFEVKIKKMKKVVITGASEGIGLEIAKLLARDGNQLLLVARNKEKLEEVIKNLPGAGHHFLVADLSKKEDVHTISDHIENNHYDVLINNAGAGMYGRFEELPIAAQVNMIQLNIIGLTKLAHSFIKTAKAGDSLVNLSSTLGTTSFPGTAVYAATKAYVSNFSDSLWWENKTRGVFVLGFCPGVTQTNFHQTAKGDEDIFPRFIIQTPEAVAGELVRALKRRRKPKVVSGGINRFMLFFHRFLGRKMVVNMMGGFSPVKK